MPAGYDAWGGEQKQARRIKRGCSWSRRTSVTGQPWQTRNARAGAEVGWRAEPVSSVNKRTAHRGRCALRRVGNVSALQIRCPSSCGRGVGDAAPYGVCVWVCFCGAARWADCLGIVSTPVASYSARPVSLLLVGCTVLGAPWLRDRLGNVGADGQRDQWHPCFPRRVRLASTTQRMKSRGHSPRTFCEAGALS